MIVLLIQALHVLQNHHLSIPDPSGLSVYHCFEPNRIMTGMGGVLTSGAVDSSRVNQEVATLPLHSGSKTPNDLPREERNLESVSDSGTFQVADGFE